MHCDIHTENIIINTTPKHELEGLMFQNWKFLESQDIYSAKAGMNNILRSISKSTLKDTLQSLKIDSVSIQFFVLVYDPKW